jgi:sugar lactone lactonase YvrE
MSDPIVFVDGLAFPEGPRWYGDRLWLSDVVNGHVVRIALDGTREIAAAIGDRPSGLGFLPDGSLLVVAMTTHALWRVAKGKAELYADLRDFGGDFLNDMVVDADGRAYIGVRHSDLRAGFPMPEPPNAPDSVILVQPDRSASVGADQLVSPNGSVITANGRTLIVAETYVHRLTAFDRAPDGTLHSRRVFADVAGAYPDGICLDAEGAIWVGSPYTDEFVRVREGGEITDRIEVPGGVACALGGPDRRTLFLLAVDPSSLPRPGVLPDTDLLHDATSFAGGRVLTQQVAVGGAGWP